jgi:hypothetical protein
MKTYFHIGQHKTGTTSIQHYLKKFRSELMSKGWFVPDSIAGFNHPSHFILNVYALDADRYSHMKRQLLAKHGNEFFNDLEHKLKESIVSNYEEARRHSCHSLIWSNEGLYLLKSREEYAKLLNLVRHESEENICVCCFREVNEYRKSYLQELKKTGEELSSDPRSYTYTEEDSFLFDYPLKQALLTSCFDRCQFFNYVAEDNVKAFLQVLDIAPIGNTNLRLNVTN